MDGRGAAATSDVEIVSGRRAKRTLTRCGNQDPLGWLGVARDNQVELDAAIRRRRMSTRIEAHPFLCFSDDLHNHCRVRPAGYDHWYRHSGGLHSIFVDGECHRRFLDELNGGVRSRARWTT